MAVVVTLIFAHLTFIRPARKEMAQLHHQVGALQRHIEQLAAHGQTAATANQLLVHLTQQAAQTAEATEALAAMETLHQRLNREAAVLDEAHQAITAMAKLRDEVQKNVTLIDQASHALMAMNELQEDLLSGADATTEAQAISYDLLALKRQLVDEGQEVATAHEALEQLIGIRTELDQQGTDIEVADRRAKELIELKNKVLARTDDLAGSIETFERAIDLQQQFEEASQSFHEIRHLLTEMTMLRSGVRQVVEHFKPLSDLVNLRRLTPAEIRQMAQTIVDQRREQIAAKENAGSEPSPAGRPAITKAVTKADLTSASTD